MKDTKKQYPRKTRNSRKNRQAPHELADMLDSLAGFRQQRFVGLEHVEHARPDFELHLHSIRLRFGCRTRAVVADDLVLAGLDQERWDAAVIAKDGRGQRVVGIHLAQVEI